MSRPLEHRPLDAPSGCFNGVLLGVALWLVLFGPALWLWVATR